jgi:flagellar protein FliS
MYRKSVEAYVTVERDSAVESNDPHAMISALLNELLKRMNLFKSNLKGDEAALRRRNEAYARSIAILHALQGSLDFENGGEIADNLFLVYEFARLQLLESFRSGEVDRIDVAITSLREIAGAWDQIDNPLANSAV